MSDSQEDEIEVMSLDEIQNAFKHSVGHRPHSVQQMLVYCKQIGQHYKFRDVNKWWPNRPEPQEKLRQKAINVDGYKSVSKDDKNKKKDDINNINNMNEEEQDQDIINKLKSELETNHEKAVEDKNKLQQKINELQEEITTLNMQYKELEKEKCQSMEHQNEEFRKLKKINEELRYKLEENDEKKENTEINDDEDEIFKTKFKEWLFDTVKLKQYAMNFEENECNDVRMIEFFEEDAIKNEIGINKTFHRKLILKEANQYKKLQNEFDNMLENNKRLKQYQEIFKLNGILRVQDLKNDIKTKQQLGKMLKITDNNKINELWETFNPNADAIDVAKPNNEGQWTEYH